MSCIACKGARTQLAKGHEKQVGYVRVLRCWSGEVNEPMGRLRPFNWLIRRVRGRANK